MVSTERNRLDLIKKAIPDKLAERNLKINQSKTEEYKIEPMGKVELEKVQNSRKFDRNRRRYQHKEDIDN